MSSGPESDREGGDADQARLLEALVRTLPPLINPVQLSLAEIRKAFEPVIANYPPVLSLEQAAEIAHLAPSTLKRKVSEGAFRESAKRGKPLKFWRDKFVQELMR